MARDSIDCAQVIISGRGLHDSAFSFVRSACILLKLHNNIIIYTKLKIRATVAKLFIFEVCQFFPEGISLLRQCLVPLLQLPNELLALHQFSVLC